MQQLSPASQQSSPAEILFVYALHAGAWNAEYDGCPEKNQMRPRIGLPNHSGGIVDEASCSHDRLFWYSV